ncbi:mediator complex, subunit Med10 [Xylariaceae sp. FL0594]|nr:mediator complex, subunit Med10 [Xylariaceae sp. FL0594]
MAPSDPVNLDVIEQQLKDAIQSMHNIMVQVTSYDSSATNSTLSAPPSTHTPNNNINNNNFSSATSSPSPYNNNPSSRNSRDVLSNEITSLSRSLQQIYTSSRSSSSSLPQVPPELITYVDNGRNPDIYTREFVELVRRANQLMSGKQRAFARFGRVLAAQIEAAMPEIREDAARVVEATSIGNDGSP